MIKKWYAGGLKYPFCLAMLLLLCANLQAQEAEKTPVKVTLDEAVNLAIKNNLSLESSRTSLATKKRASDYSWNQFIPNITVAGILSRDNEESDPTKVTFPVPYPGAAGTSTTINGIHGNVVPLAGFFISDPIEVSQWHIVGNIQMSLTVSAAMFENMKRLRIDYEGGLLSYDKAKLQLERDVRKAYHNILLLQENIALMRGSYANVERQVQMAQANYNAGLAPELTLLQARVARENMRPVIDQVENGMKLSMAQFAMFLGLSYDTNFELEPLSDNIGFISLDVMDTISKASKEKPDIRELRNTIMMLQSARRAQIYALTPSLSLGWSSASAFIKDPWKDPWFDSGDDWRKSGSFSLTLALRLHSLIPFSTDFQGIKNLDDQIKTATIGLAQMVNGTEIEVYNAVLSLEKTRANAKAQEETVRLAEQSYRLTEEAYRAGLQDYFQVQNAEQSLRQARVQLLEQQFNYLNGLIDLEYSLGVPFGTLSERSK
jgi:outer membrane protein TolC